MDKVLYNISLAPPSVPCWGSNHQPWPQVNDRPWKHSPSQFQKLEDISRAFDVAKCKLCFYTLIKFAEMYIKCLLISIWFDMYYCRGPGWCACGGIPSDQWLSSVLWCTLHVSSGQRHCVFSAANSAEFISGGDTKYLSKLDAVTVGLHSSAWWGRLRVELQTVWRMEWKVIVLMSNCVKIE